MPVPTGLHHVVHADDRDADYIKVGKMQKVEVDSEPRHSTDFRTIFEIIIG